MKKTSYCLAALRRPLAKPLIYKSIDGVREGSRLMAPLGGREVLGVALCLKERPPPEIRSAQIRPVTKVLPDPPISAQRLQWLVWMSRYYRYPLGLTLDMNFLPPLQKPPKKLLQEHETPVLKAPPGAQPEPSLNAEQRKAVQAVLKTKGFKPHLLYGVTGSGKTEVYKALLKKTLQNGGQGLILLPEIFLVSHLFPRFLNAFPEAAVLHSQVLLGQKRQIFHDLRTGRKNLLIGTRSALFCPLPRLRLIVVDEEHSQSFKQEEQFLYHARDSAVMLAKKHNIPIVLGSATPDLSTWNLAMRGTYTLHTLKKRAVAKRPPKVYLVDLRSKPFKAPWISDTLYLKIKETLEMGRQTALLLNRRGIAGLMLCPNCGHVRRCPNCSISLTLHAGGSSLCHYCDYMEKKDGALPELPA